MFREKCRNPNDEVCVARLLVQPAGVTQDARGKNSVILCNVPRERDCNPNNEVFAARLLVRPSGVTKDARGKNSVIRRADFLGETLKFQCHSRKVEIRIMKFLPRASLFDP